MREKLLQLKSIIEELLAEQSGETQAEQISEIQKVEPKKTLNLTKEFDVLKSLLLSDSWPEAVFSSQIADEDSETDKEERAEGICDIILPPLQGKKFLDFGCGEGHAVSYMSKSTFSVGFDISKNSKSRFLWEENKNNFILTTDFEKVKQNGPYDAVLLYDVIDHVVGESATEMLSKIKSILKPSGKIYARCHPWSSRHGGHAYKKINKAFVHLVFNKDEIEALELNSEELLNNQKIVSSAKYDVLFESADLQQVSKEIDSQEVEPFFGENPLVKQRILNSLGLIEWKLEEPIRQMSECFVDFVLSLKQ